MINKIISKSLTKKIITGIISCFLVFSALVPLSNFQIKALLISIDVVNRTEGLLNAVSLSQINEIVLNNMLSEINNTGGLPINGKKKQNNVNTNLDCNINSDTKKVFKVIANFINCPVFSIDDFSNNLLGYYEVLRYGPSIMNMYLNQSIHLSILKQFARNSLARGDTGFNLSNYRNTNTVTIPNLSI